MLLDKTLPLPSQSLTKAIMGCGDEEVFTIHDGYWKREELYKEVWEQPLLKLAPKYGISAVALGRSAGDLKYPFPVEAIGQSSLWASLRSDFP
jgi:hypothetical protein